MRRARRRWATLLKVAAHVPVAPLAVLVLVATAAVERFNRRPSRQRPRLFWGPIGIISIKHWSGAMRALGYDSTTFVNDYPPANARDDFDICRKDLYWRTSKADSLKAYPALAAAIRRYDVFTWFFDGGLLADTPLWWAEAPLLKWAGKKIVMIPYGADIAIPGYLGPWEEAMIRDYPGVKHRAAVVRRKVDHYCRHADLVIGNLQVGYLPRRDVLWINHYGVDTELWSPPAAGRSSGGGDVVVLHAPNHRALKGTEFVIKAIDELRADGVAVSLRLVERKPHAELREEIRDADIVVDQLLLGFGYFAVESLSCGKPVVSNIGWMPSELRSLPSMKECPLIDAGPSTVAGVVRHLVDRPDVRESVGRAGREWALKHHSYDAVGAVWDQLFRSVWTGAPLPEALVAEDLSRC